MKYIAYGSNMNLGQMAFRCPGAKVVGVGHIKDFRLEFYLHATIEHRKGESVPVVVWEINDNHLKTLDFYEGFPSYYIKRNMKVDMPNGKKIKGMVYLMNNFRDYPPTNDYVEGIKEAYRTFNLEDEIPNIDKAIERANWKDYYVVE